MRVENSPISLSSQYTAMFRSSETTSLQYATGNQAVQSEKPPISGTAQGDHLHLSEPAKRSQPVRYQHKIDRDEKLSSLDDLKSKLAKLVFKALTGEDFKLFEPKELLNAPIDTSRNLELTAAPANQPVNGASSGTALQYDYYASSYQYQSISFSAQGIVKTKDGQEINFSIELSVSQEFYSEQQVSFRAGDAMSSEPLLVDFQSNAAELTQTHFSLSLDLGGRSDQLALVTPEAAAPATQTRQRRSRPDDDSSFISKGIELRGGRHHRLGGDDDSIYEKLRLWFRQPGGDQQLLALGQKGLGAIYIGHLQPPSAVTDGPVAAGSNSPAGSIGDAQQIDLLA